jgi:hypothetical protein
LYSVGISSMMNHLNFDENYTIEIAKITNSKY